MKEILVIMGSHPRTRDEFDWTRTDCDIVVFNEAMKQDWVKRADYVMQLHLPVIWRNPGNRNDANHYEWLASGNTPIIYMQEQYDDVPRSAKYPIDEVCKMGRNYITSSAAYSIALGVHLGYQKIEIYGTEMETNTEYQYQRPGVTYWIGFAEGAGVEVDFHGNLLKSPLYGYEGDIKFPYAYFDERIAELQVSAMSAMKTYNDARDAANVIMSEYTRTGKDPQEVIKLLQRQVELGAMFGLHDGARQEVMRYKNKADVQIKATNDYLFSRQEFEHAVSSFVKQRDSSIITATRMAEECQRSFKEVQDTGNTQKRRFRMEKFTKIVIAYVQESVKVGMYDGAMKENKLFMATLDNYTRMAGGEKSEEVLREAARQGEAI